MGALEHGARIAVIMDLGCTVCIMSKYFHDQHSIIRECFHIPQPSLQEIIKLGDILIELIAILIVNFKLGTSRFELDSFPTDS